MQHHPIDSFDWKRIIKRAELPRTTKLIAGFLGDFADRDGSNVRPGVVLLAEMAGVTERTVKTHLKVLREAGLIEKTRHSRMLGQADVYRLTIPGVDHAPVPMRLDPDGERLDATLPEATGPTPNAVESVDNTVDEPVDNPSDGTPATGSYVKPDAALGEAGRRSRGSQLHPTNQTNHYQPFSGLPQATNSLAAAPTTDHGEADAGRGFDPDDADYAAAHEILMCLPDGEPHWTVALAELAAAGIADPTNRQLVVRAADVATRPHVPDQLESADAPR